MAAMLGTHRGWRRQPCGLPAPRLMYSAAMMAMLPWHADDGDDGTHVRTSDSQTVDGDGSSVSRPRQAKRPMEYAAIMAARDNPS